MMRWVFRIFRPFCAFFIGSCFVLYALGMESSPLFPGAFFLPTHLTVLCKQALWSRAS